MNAKFWKYLAISAGILNIFDAIFTSYLVSKGLASELNPIMDAVLRHSTLLFFIIKIGILPLFYLLSRYGSKILIGFIFSMYLFVVSIQVYYLLLLLFNSHCL